MTNHVKIQGVIPRIQYTADGTSTDYEFPFAIFTSDDLDVYLDDTLQSTISYTVNGIRHSDGGTVSFNEAPAIDTTITIVRNLSIERTTDFQEGGALRADVLNDELDYQIACQQQISDNLNRTLVLPPYASGNDIDLILPEPMAGKAIVWNASGTGLENSDVSVNSLGSTLLGYKQSAEAAVGHAQSYAQEASSSALTAANSASTATSAAEAAQASVATAVQSSVEAAVAAAAEILQSGEMDSDNSVNLTDNQSINGTKTFCSQIQTNTTSNGGVICLNSTYDFQNAQTVSADVPLFQFEGKDSGNHTTGGISQTYTTDGNLVTQIGAKRYLNNAYVSSGIECCIDDSGVRKVTTLTPASSTDASNQIATTKWIENQRKSGYGIGIPNWNAPISLTTGITHTITDNGWVTSSGSIRLNASTGKQICSSGSLVTVPLAAGSVIYVSGITATFYPSL